MRFCKVIIIVPFLWWPFEARAQVSQPVPMLEQWQITLDVIKSKAQELVVENNALEAQYQQSTRKVKKLQMFIGLKQEKNDQLSQMLKQMHGRTQQQFQAEELTKSVKNKKQLLSTLDEQSKNLKRKQADLDNEIERIKGQSSPDAGQSSVDDELAPWHKNLEDATRQEVLLEDELKALKAGAGTVYLNEGNIEAQNKELQTRLDSLMAQRSGYIKSSSNAKLAEANVRKYDQLSRRKNELEADIRGYEMRMDELRETSLTELSWTLKRKKLIHEMVQTDARNNQMRDKVKELREDINVLKDQVGKLEAKVNQVKDQAAMQ